MPLERAKDSFVNLQQVKEQWLKQAKPNVDGKTKLEWYDDEESTFWEPPKDPQAFERIVPLKDPPKQCCGFPPCWAFKPSQEEEKDNSNNVTWESESDMELTKSRSGGIVRRASLAVQVFLGLPNAKRKSFHPITYKSRSARDRLHLHVSFAPEKRVVTIRPLWFMSMDDKRSVWWQYEDFEGFQISASLLIKSTEANQELCAIWLAGISGTADGTPPKDVDNNDSWWHKYQHSRRGLERYASSEEAKEIQQSYRTAIQAVMQEQRRQRFWHSPNPDKLAQIYHEYTVWSRDLALAAGASDADAVQCDFDDSKRKSREYFLLKQLYKSDEHLYKHTPAFMLPGGMKPKGFLDE